MSSSRIKEVVFSERRGFEGPQSNCMDGINKAMKPNRVEERGSAGLGRLVFDQRWAEGFFYCAFEGGGGACSTTSCPMLLWRAGFLNSAPSADSPPDLSMLLSQRLSFRSVYLNYSLDETSNPLPEKHLR